MNLVVGAMGVLAGGAVASLLLCKWKRGGLAIGLGAIVVAGALCIGLGLSVLNGHPVAEMKFAWAMPLETVLSGSAGLAVDGLSAWFILAVGILSIAAAIYAWGYLQEDVPKHPVAVHAGMLCLLVLSMLLVLCATNAILFLMGWELMSVSAFVLIGLDDRRAEVRRAAWMYLIATHVGTAMGVFPLFAVLMGRSGSADFAPFAATCAAMPTAACVGVFALGLIGFGTKAGFMPGHVWLPVAHPAAPSPVSALMSGVVIKTGIYGLLRLLSWLPPLPVGCANFVIGLGAVGGIMGILYALSQGQLKRMLAYSSVENIGIITLGIGVGMLGRTLRQPLIAELAFAGVVLHVLNHAMFKGLLFLSAGAVLHGTGTADLEQLGGLARKTPMNAAMFLVGAVAICALPPLNGFVSEWFIYSAMFTTTYAGTPSVAASGVIGLTSLVMIGGLALASFAKVFSVVFLGEPRNKEIHAHPTPKSMLVGMMIPAAVCLMIGLMPWLVWPRLQAAIAPLGLASGGAVQVVDGTMRPLLMWMSGMLGILVMICGGLLFLRAKCGQQHRVAGEHPTWGCGYPYPAARVQYTGSSFGWSLMSSFRPVLQTRREVKRPVGYFPRPGEVVTRTPDLPLTKGFQPLFSGIARSCQMLWPLQHGRIQLYLVYIALTLVAVFVVEACWPPYLGSRDTAAAPMSSLEQRHEPVHRQEDGAPGGHR